MSAQHDLGVECRLATYGTLAPGRVNHHQVSMMAGRWREGTIRGQLIEGGWGASLGFPGLILNEDGPEISVYLFESEELPAHWARLDAFEGPGYRRVSTFVRTEGEALPAYIYALADKSE